LQAIADLQVAYLAEIGGINRGLMTALRASEADRQVEEGTRMVAVMSGDLSRGMPFGPGARGPRGGEDDPFREGMDRRDDTDQRYVEQIRAMLTPEQQEALPARRGGRGGGPGGGQAGAGGGNADRRAEMIQRFDTNGDGELNEEERRAMFESFRNGGGRGNRGGGNGGGGQSDA
jgi:hypothetical protein